MKHNSKTIVKMNYTIYLRVRKLTRERITKIKKQRKEGRKEELKKKRSINKERKQLLMAMKNRR